MKLIITAAALTACLSMAVHGVPSGADALVASTPQSQLSQERAVAAYPDIGVKGSELNKAFVDVFNHWKTWKPEQLQRDNWPELVAREAVRVLMNRRAEEKRQKTIIIER
ncbi:MAG: hypothetical protein QOE70_4330 [Chthoniobacter sp.]|jgi:hypothetical protein|nr:hypothetical protein [Chthoniobacter sp.]